MAEPQGGRGGQKGGYALPPDYGRSVNPITTEGQIMIPQMSTRPPHFQIFHQPCFQECLLFLKFNSKLHTSSIIISFLSGFNIFWIFSMRPKCIWEAKIASWVQFFSFNFLSQETQALGSTNGFCTKLQNISQNGKSFFLASFLQQKSYLVELSVIKKQYLSINTMLKSYRLFLIRLFFQ